MRVPNATRHSRWILGLIGLAIAAAVMGTAGWAMTSEENVIRGCNKPDDYVRIVAPNVACKKGETSIEWNRQGPPGEQGPPGSGARAYAVVYDFDGLPEPILDSVRSLNIRSVVKGTRGTYCVLLDPSIPNVNLSVPVVSPNNASPVMAAVGYCEVSGVV